MILWHNPRCATSRKTLALLQDRGITPELRLYLQAPPSLEELQELRAMLGRPTIEMVRVKEPLFRELALSRDSAETDLLSAMSAHPALIERPVLIHDGQARIGRPPEAVLDIL